MSVDLEGPVEVRRPGQDPSDGRRASRHATDWIVPTLSAHGPEASHRIPNTAFLTPKENGSDAPT